MSETPPSIHSKLQTLWKRVMKTDSDAKHWRIRLDRDSLYELRNDNAAGEFTGDGSLIFDLSGSTPTLKWRDIPITTVYHLDTPEIGGEASMDSAVIEKAKHQQITIEYQNRAGRMFYLDDEITSKAFTAP